jgi:ABC-type uncharacterized transport system substrate-binding protein
LRRTIYAYRSHVMSGSLMSAGSLMSYGLDNLEQYRRAAGYVDRSLRGEKPAELRCKLRRNTITRRHMSRAR